MKVKIIFKKEKKIQICVCSLKDFPSTVLLWQGLGYSVLNSVLVD